jgi:hypothetical protein
MYLCSCVVFWRRFDPLTCEITEYRDSCLVLTNGPDEPFCDQCEDRHVDDPVKLGMERVSVTAEIKRLKS